MALYTTVCKTLRSSGIAFLLFSPIYMMAQGQVINLNNASFEGIPGPNNVPSGWVDCGAEKFPLETPPDIQPSGAWDVTKPAQNGRTYLGMVVRENESWESVSQRLSEPLMKGKKYSFSIYICTSEIYKSPTSADRTKKVNYTKPAKLIIYAGNDYCQNLTQLGASKVITNNDWRRFDFVFSPTRTVSYITFQAFYETPVLFPYNGNILIDNASPIKEINPSKTVAKNKETKPKVVEKSTVSALNSKVKPGQIIRIDELYFQADTSNINPSSYKILDEVYKFMMRNRRVVIEIGGHTNGVPSNQYCMTLSTARAKEVAEYLINKGVPAYRVKYKGYGKSKPVASDRTADGRRKNQRVEIKILST